MWKLVNSGGVVKQKFYQKEMCDSEGGSTLHVKAEQIWRLGKSQSKSQSTDGIR